ncbi:MAG: hypothetical protein ABI867_22135 [Kofleriaceae bacterium]
MRRQRTWAELAAGHLIELAHAAIGGPPSQFPSCSSTTSSRITGMPASRYLFVYDGLGHQFDGTNGAAMMSDVAQLLATK